MTRCSLHGGKGPASIIKAQTMMATARLPAIEALYTILEQFESSRCGLCGFPTGDTDEKRMIIQACRTVLDRCGMGPSQTINTAPQKDADLNIELLTPEERGELYALLAQVNELRARVHQRQTQIVSTPGMPDGNPAYKM
jgi:hypothetical protein